MPEDETCVRVESGNEEMDILLFGNNNVFPWRWKIRMPDFVNLQVLPYLQKGQKVADIVAILGSIGIIMGSVDR